MAGRGLHTAILALAALGASPAVARAQTAIELNGIDDVAELSLERILDTQVLAASRYEQLASEAPSALSVITADEIRAFGYRTLADVLQAQRGFYTTDDHNYQFIGVRGFDLPGDYSSRVLVLVDGHRLNDGLYSQAFIGDELAVDLDDVARIELVRGPGSSVYGSNAFFAVINVVTLRGADLRGVRASVAGSLLDDTHATPRGGGTRALDGGRLSLAWGDVVGGVDVMASVSYSTSGGIAAFYFPEIDGNPDVTCVDRAGAEMPCDGMARDLDGERAWRARARATYGRFTLHAGAVSRDKQIPTAPYGTIFGEASETTDRRAFASLEYADRRERLELSARVYYDLYQYDGSYPFDERTSPDQPLAGGRQLSADHDRHQGLGAEAQLVADVAPRGILDRARVAAGVEARHSLQGHFASFLGPEVLLDVDGAEGYLAAHAQAEARLAGRLQLSGGLRLDHDLGSSETTLNPRLAAIVTPASGTHLKLLYGTAFRAPSTYERLRADPTIGAVVNPDLRAEHITTVEAVVEQYLGKALRATLAGYWYGARDLIAFTAADDGSEMFRNLARATTRGLELELEGRWGGTRTRLSYAWQRATNPETGERLVNSPLRQFKLNLLVPLVDERLTLGLESQYMAARRTLSGGEVAPCFLTNLALVYDGLVPGLTLSLAVRNLLDEDYATPAPFDHVQATLRQAPRTFWLKASQRF